MFFTLGMWMFLTAIERSMNAWDLPPAAETVVTVPRAVEEESRDVRAGVLRYLIKLVNYSCSVFCKVNYQ